jgi:hypothetical protein
MRNNGNTFFSAIAQPRMQRCHKAPPKRDFSVPSGGKTKLPENSGEMSGETAQLFIGVTARSAKTPPPLPAQQGAPAHGLGRF